MKIAIFGWYGHHNAGDERIKFCLRSFLMNLGGIKIVNFYDLHEQAIKGATNKFDHYNLVIIGGGGLIFSQCNYHDFILGLKTKVVTLGISVETALKGNPKKFALSLLKKSKTILARDQRSYKQLTLLDCEGKVRASADLTFLVPFKLAIDSKKKCIGINLLPKPKSFKYSTLSNQLLAFLLGKLERIGLGNLLSTVSFYELLNLLINQHACLPIPLYCCPQDSNIPTYRKNDVNFLKNYFNNVPNSFSHGLIDQCFVLFSMRLHAAIFAVQKGIPIISFEYLPKNRSFMTEVGLEDFVVNSVHPNAILRLIERSQKDITNIREKMAFFTEVSSEKVRKDLIEILNSI